MKKNLLFITFFIVIFSISLVVLTGCGNSETEKSNDNSTTNNEVKNQKNEVDKQKNQVKNAETTPKNSKQMTIDAWFKLPTNLDYFIEKTYSNGTSVSQNHSKRGNDILLNLSNHYYFYKYTDNNIWTSNEYIEGKGWDSFYYKGCIITTPSSSEEMMLKKLDNYTTKHEKFSVEGVGEVDTVIGKDGDDTYYYSKDLKINVKVVTKNITIVVTKFDKNVTKYPHSIPENV